MEQIFLCVLNMSISAGYVILAVLLARLLLRRAPKKYSYALWLVVAFRLCCLVSFRSGFSLFRLVFFDTGATLQFVPMDIGMMPQPEVNVGIGSANAIINSALPAATPQYSANPMQIWLIIAALVWCAGIAVMLLWFLLRHGILYFRLRTATRLVGNVFESERVDAPFAMGLFCPRIYLPYGLDAETQRHVLAHERYHLRHGDHILRQLAFLILSLHWFNPLCWLAYVLMGRDMELRCDEGVLAGGDHDPADYSAALLRFAAPRRFPAPGPLTFGEPAASQRIRNALRWHKPKRWVTVLAVAAVVAVVLGCAANPAALLDGAEISHATNDETGEILSVEAAVSLAALLSESDYTLYTGKEPWDSSSDDWITLWCTDGSRYELHYWYCSGFSFHPAHFGEDDYYSILTHYNAEGDATRRWKLAYEFDAEYRLWRETYTSE